MTDPTPASDALVAELREAAEKATPGPWLCGRIHDPDGRSREVRAVVPELDEAWEHTADAIGVIDRATDSAYIAAANPAAIASLLARLDAQTRTIEHYKRWLDEAEADRDRWKALFDLG